MAQATVYGGHQLESSCAEEPLAAAPGDREPRPGREQGGLEASAPQERLLHQLCVLKSKGRPWTLGRLVWEPQLPFPSS